MTTAQNAVLALRKIHTFTDMRPRDWQFQRCIALNELGAGLKCYAQNFPSIVDHAYNERCRRENWYPVPFAHQILSAQEAQGLLFTAQENAEAIATLSGFKELAKVALDAGVLLKLWVRPDGVSITCDFLTETPGEIRVST